MLQNKSRYYLIENQALPSGISCKVLPEMKETLGQLIQRRMKDVDIPSKAELARKLGISSAYAGDLANDTGKTKDGTYMPSPELTAKLVEVLKISENEILNAIGYASEKSSPLQKPTTPVEFFDALDRLGLDIQFDGGRKVLEGMDEEDLQELLDTVVASAVAKSKRKRMKV